MIQVNELRRGNWILLTHLNENVRNEFKKVEGVLPTSIMVPLDNQDGAWYPQSLNQFEPIPLTPEIFIKADLINITDSLCFTNKDNSVAFFKGEQGYYACWEDAGRESSISIIGKPFHYVHQLQNLYFALTGEELNIEL